MLNLDLLRLSSALKTRNNADLKQVFDPVRRKWIALTPEELVRQLLIRYFLSELQFPVSRMSVERQISVHGMSRRYDLVLWSQRPDPILLVECKAPAVEVNQSVLDQIAQYNIALQVPYLLVTNGHQSYCCSIDLNNKTWEFLEDLPVFE